MNDPSRYSNVSKLDDDSRMTFGKHKGKRLGEIEDGYWHWFLCQDWCDSYPDLVEYANRCVGD